MAASRCVRCMQCLCCGFVLGRRGQLSRRSSIQGDEISCIRDHPRSLLSELQVMIPKVERNGVCICMVYPTLWPGGTAECVYRPPLRLVPSVLMSVRFLWLCRLPLRNFLVCVFCWISYWLWPLYLKGSYRRKSYGLSSYYGTTGCCVYSSVKSIRSPWL